MSEGDKEGTQKGCKNRKDGRKSDSARDVSLMLNLFFSCESCVRAIPAYVPFSLWQVPVTGFNLTHEQRQRSMPFAKWQNVERSQRWLEKLSSSTMELDGQMAKTASLEKAK